MHKEYMKTKRYMGQRMEKKQRKQNKTNKQRMKKITKIIIIIMIILIIAKPLKKNNTNETEDKKRLHMNRLLQKRKTEKNTINYLIIIIKK